MRKLLSILGTMMLAGTTSTNVIACGGSKEEPINPEDNGVKIEDLLIKAENKVKAEFGDLINKSKNLFLANQSPSGEDYHQLLLNMPSAEDTEITPDSNIKKSFIDFFIKRIQNNINDDILPQLLLDKDLRLLFNGIANSNILKINKNNTKFWKMLFKWQPEKKDAIDFGIKNYNPSQYKIKYWYKIKIDLNLELTYNNEKNQQVKKIINQNYTCYYANSTANIAGVIRAASLEVKNKFAKKIITIKLNKNDDINDKARSDIATKNIIKILENDNILIKDNVFVNDSITKITTNDNYYADEARKFYEAFNQSQRDSILYLEDYFKNQIVANFNSKLDKWSNALVLDSKEKAKITKNEDKINIFGKIKLVDWTISGLTLKSVNLNFINVRQDQTRTKWATFMAETLAKIFAKDGYIKDAFNIINDDKNLVMFMNRNDFENYYQENNNLRQVSSYFEDKIVWKAKKEISDFGKTPLRIWLNNASEEATLQNNNYVQKIDDSTLAVIKNSTNYNNGLSISLDNFWFDFGSQQYKGNYLTFNSWIIKKADSNIWD